MHGESTPVHSSLTQNTVICTYKSERKFDNKIYEIYIA